MAIADLHVHSKASKRPSEWFLQKVGAKESYTDIDTLYSTAKAAGMDFVTVTDHNTIDLAYSVAHGFYSINKRLSIEILEKLILLFDVFEGLNGARNSYFNETWQDILKSLNPEKIHHLTAKHGIQPMSSDPWIKGFTGGSDDHAGLFIGQTATKTDSILSKKSFIQQIKKRKTYCTGRCNDYKSFAFFISIPFFSSLSHLSRDRELMITLKQKYNGKDSIAKEKVLWFSDTFNDLNGVSIILENFRRESLKRNLNILFVTCIENKDERDREKMSLFKCGMVAEPLIADLARKRRFLDEKGIQSGTTLLWAGRMSRDKNIEFLLDIYQTARKTIRELNLVLCGDGPELDVYKIECSAHERIHFMGMVDNREFLQYCETADLFVFPGATDTFGMVILEAWSQGLPVLISDVGGVAGND